MKNPIQLTNANYPTEDLPRPALWRRVHVLILGLTLAWFICSPLVRAQFECPPRLRRAKQHPLWQFGVRLKQWRLQHGDGRLSALAQ